MRIKKLSLLACTYIFLIFNASAKAASAPASVTPDFGDNNKPYQACFKACDVYITKCYPGGNGTNSRSSANFNYRVECSNRQLDCQFSCKDKYNVQ